MSYVVNGQLTIPTVEEIITAIEADQRDLIDANIDTGPETFEGQLNSIVATQLRIAWEALKQAWDARDPNNAEEGLLDAVCELTGTTRLAATPSFFRGSKALKLNLQAGAVVAEGSLFEVEDSSPPIRVLTTQRVEATLAGYYLVEAECTETAAISTTARASGPYGASISVELFRHV